MAKVLARVGSLLSAVLILLTFSASVALAGAKPPDPVPEELSHGQTVGIHKETGEYCDQDDPKLGGLCRAPRDCEIPGTVCVGEGSKDPDEAHRAEVTKLERWREKTNKGAENYSDLNNFLTKCVEVDKRTFQDCFNQGSATYPPPAKTPVDWAAGQISEMAADALEEAASYIGESVVWLLDQFAKIFNSVSTIDLGRTGINSVLGISMTISVIAATFLLLLQFGKLAISQKGDPLVTAVTGLAKWAVILAVYTLAVQTALDWSDALSAWVINVSFEGGGSGAGDASDAMQKQLGTLFAALASGGGAAAAGGALVSGGGFVASAVGVVIIVGILCILAIGALWVEMLLRQAGIMILVAVMPIVLAGQLADSTRDWWPKARNALIALIMMKPVITLCFAIGFSAMSQGSGIQNVIVGLIIFVLACVSWPVLARFMTFTSTGDGSSAASGVMGTVSSSLSSVFGSERAVPSGVSRVGGSGYAKALEEDNSATATSGSNAAGGRSFWSQSMLGGSGSFVSKVGVSVGLGLQVASAGKDILESNASNTAAHAGVGQASPGGGNTVVPPRRDRYTEPASAQPSPTAESEPPAPTTAGKLLPQPAQPPEGS